MKGFLLAIDPGVAGQGCACAAFAAGGLMRVWFERAAAFGAVMFAPDVVVVERPVYQGARSDGARAGDLMALAWEGALLAGLYAGRNAALVVEWPSSDTATGPGWKGSEPKPVQHARLWALLDANERDILGGDATARAIMAAREKGALNRWGRPGASYYPRSFTAHNTLDAVALGMTYLGRLKRTGR